MKFLWLFSFMLGTSLAIDSEVSLCRTGNMINLDYMNSAHVITKVKSSVKSDTLYLTIRVSSFTQNKNLQVAIPKGVKYVTYGKITKQIDQLYNCPKVLSGKEALETLKQQK